MTQQATGIEGGYEPDEIPEAAVEAGVRTIERLIRDGVDSYHPYVARQVFAAMSAALATPRRDVRSAPGLCGNVGSFGDSAPRSASMSTNLMNWFAAAHRFLKAISESSVPKIVQFVALLLCFPCFHASHFFFRIAYTLNQRKLIRLSGESAGLSGQNGILQFNSLALQHGRIPQIYHRLRYIAGRLQAINGGHD
jgi:hypothetical protein